MKKKETKKTTKAAGGQETQTSPLKKLIQTIENQFGEGSIMHMQQGGKKVPCFSSGSLKLDAALKVGGYPKGRLVEIYGPESSGKTTIALHAIASAQQSGDICAFIDAEHALDVTYAKKLGVNIDNMLISQPDHGEQALAIALALLQSAEIDLVVIDSVAALVPKSELEGNVGDHHVGSQARMMSQAMRMLTGAANRNQASVIFINQVRQKIGVMFGSPETTTGGNALKFYTSIRLDVRRIGQLKRSKDGKDAEPYGNRTRIKVVKNKLAPPFRKAEFDLIYGTGVCRLSELIELGEDHQLLTRTGTWFSMGDTRLGQGKDKAIAFLRAHPDVAADLEAKLRHLLFSNTDDESNDPLSSDERAA